MNLPGRYKRFLFLLALLLVVAMSFGGVLTARTMLPGGTAEDCSYMGALGYCDMNVVEHLASWQNLFTTTLERPDSLAAFLPLFTLSVLAYFFVDLLVRKHIGRPLLERWRSRELFDPLQLAFARGIIHPKRHS